MTATFSVVIPAYNAAEFVAEAISSVRQQGLPTEIVVVDDASTDDTGGVARSAGVDQMVRLPANSGIGAARNRGVSLATGEYLGFLDADDLWPAGSLASRLQVMQLTRADAAFGNVEQFGRPGDAGPPSLAYLAGAMLVRREAFSRVGPFDETLAVGEFVDWYARAQEAGITVATTEALVLQRRIHGTNVGIVRRDQTVDYARVLRRALARRRGEQQT